MSDESTFEARLERNQALREKVIDRLKDDDGELPTDLKELKMILEAANDIDRTELSRRKLNIDSKNADTADRAYTLSLELQKQRNGDNPFQRDLDGAIIPSVDPEKIGHHTFVDGEMDQGIIVETLPELEERVRLQREARGEVDEQDE